jgi:hypothetical protein
MDELSRAQSSLGRALGRARAGEDRELAQKVREGGEALAHMLGGLLKLTRTHSPDNRAFDAPVAEFGRALAALGDLLGTVHLVAVEDQVYVNDIRIRAEGKAGVRDLGPELRRHNAGGVSFHGALSPEQIRALVAGLAGPAAPEAPRRSLGALLAGQGVSAVELTGIYRFRTTQAEAGAAHRDPAEVLGRLLELVGETFENLAAGRVLNPLPLRRSVMELVEAGIEAPAFWLGFPDCPPHAAHAVEVAVLSLLLGKAARLPSGALQDLGIAALVHDAGYLAPGVGEGAAALARHPVEGARIVLRQRGFSEAKLRRLRAVLEHHRDYGNPTLRPSTFGSILRLAEDYANVVRLYGAKVTRDAALGAMLKAGGKLYQPALAQLLVNALGRFPPGTLLELGDGRFGRSTAPARGAELWDRPLVRLLDPATRRPVGELLDLARGGEVRRALPG